MSAIHLKNMNIMRKRLKYNHLTLKTNKKYILEKILYNLRYGIRIY